MFGNGAGPSLAAAAGYVAVVLTAGTAQGAPLSAFSEDFEGTLSQFTDRTPATPQSAIVDDPLRSGNRVLSFVARGSGGSIFTTEAITTAGDFTVSFEYLGLGTPGDNDGDLGGFFGISTNYDPLNHGVDHYWVAGTGSFPAPIQLIDDGQWRTYTLTFASPIGQPVFLTFEDFEGSGPVAGDVYFDNIRFNDAQVAPAPLPNAVPEPASLALFAAAAAAAAFARSRRAAG